MRVLGEEAEQSFLYSSRHFGEGAILTVPCGNIALAGMLAQVSARLFLTRAL